eukprot:GHVS01045159.1.p1 GENE.GHVS01045159.1~~GHVS01045159.1.p1  ORF type:complete len:692 (+),score=77.90 GHVS01045159.1:133-2208(+)
MPHVHWASLEATDIFEQSVEESAEEDNEVIATLKKASGYISKTLLCNLFEVDGNRMCKCLSNATVTFKGPGFSIKGTSTEWLQQERGEECTEVRFSGCNVTHFRQQTPRVFRWIENKGSGWLHEHAVVFGDTETAFRFGKKMRDLRIKSFHVVRETTGNLRQYDELTKAWTCVHRDIKFKIMLRKIDYLAYIEVANAVGTILAEVEISHDENIFLEYSNGSVTWCGPDVTSKEGLYRWFSVNLHARKGELHYTYAAIETCLREHSAGRSVQTDACFLWNDEAFDRRPSHDSVAKINDGWRRVPSTKECTPPTRLLQESASLSSRLIAVGSELVYSVNGKSAVDDTNFVNALSVLKLEESGSVSSVRKMSGTSFDYEGQSLCPRQIMLHNSEQQLVFLDNDGDAFLMDIEQQVVVQKISSGAFMGHGIFPVFRGASASAESTFFCHSASSFQRMDPRSGSLTRNPPKAFCRSYVENIQLSCGATDGEGHLVMGSKLGSYRLYNGEIDRFGRYSDEKNCFKGFGDPLVYVDVDQSGSWLLGTHAKFLELASTMLADGQTSAFIKDIGTTRGQPIILKLSKLDLINHNVSADCCFTKAIFDKDETAIITSLGNLVIVWDFVTTLVSGSGEGAYTIYPMRDVVEGVAFMDTPTSRVAVSALPLTVEGTVFMQRSTGKEEALSEDMCHRDRRVVRD